MSHIAKALETAKRNPPPPEAQPSLDGIDLSALPPAPGPPTRGPFSPTGRQVAAGAAPASRRKRGLLVTSLAFATGLAALSAWWFFPRPAIAPVVIPPAAPPASAAPSVPPSPELTEKVATFAIEFLPGDPPRVLIGGQTCQAGDAVGDRLVLHEVHPDLVVFRDAAGNYYTRRF